MKGTFVVDKAQITRRYGNISSFEDLYRLRRNTVHELIGRKYFQGNSISKKSSQILIELGVARWEEK